jgi:putative glutamine amidotransferase
MPRVAIPLPHSSDPEYATRAIPQYEQAITQAGGEPIRIPLDQPPTEIKKLIATCDAVLLPGSKADVEPAKFRAPRSPQTAPADAPRQNADELLLEDAYLHRKPILGICYGLQSLNVFRSGSLIQHIPDFLPEKLRTRVDHAAGKKSAIAHTVEVGTNSTLAEILRSDTTAGAKGPTAQSTLILPVNSSHHQSADAIGQGLRIAARCPADGIIEALEGTSPDHFVLAVQWHPERSVEEDESSRSIFRALVEAARARRKELKTPVRNSKAGEPTSLHP